MKARCTLILIPILLTACAAPAQPSASAPPSSTTGSAPTPSAVVRSSVGGMSFAIPASWQEVRPRVWTMPVGPRLFLSNAPIIDPCASSFRGDKCWKPLAELPSDGILVTFAGSGTAEISSPSPVPQEIAVSIGCREMGGERELATSFLGFGISACLRGPDLATNEALFDQFLSSMKRS